MNRIWSLGFQINIPIFDGFATSAAIQQSESTLKQVQLGGTQVKTGVEFEVRNAYLNLIGAQTRIEVQREAVAQAQESVRIANLQFQNGIITTVALTDTQLALAQAEVNRPAGIPRLRRRFGNIRKGNRANATINRRSIISATGKRREKLKNVLVVILIVLAIGAILVLPRFLKSPAPEVEEMESAAIFKPVEIAKATRGEIRSELELSGTIQAESQVNVFPKIAGPHYPIKR